MNWLVTWFKFDSHTSVIYIFDFKKQIKNTVIFNANFMIFQVPGEKI